MTNTYLGFADDDPDPADLVARFAEKQPSLSIISATQDPYNAPTNGISDAYSALHSAAIALGTTGVLYLPPGTYRVSQNLTFNCCVEFALGAMILRDNGVTVTFNGFTKAGLQQIDANPSRTGTLAFGAGVVQALHPEWWGARSGDGTSASTHCEVAIQKAMEASPSGLGRVVLAYGAKYYMGDSAEIPHNGGLAQLEVRGIGSQLLTDQPISMLRRQPADQTEAMSMIGMRFVCKGVTFIGSLLEGQRGLDLGATYGSVIEDCLAYACDIGFNLKFCLNAHLVRCFHTQSLTYGAVAGCGDWDGADKSNSQSNHTTFDKFRGYALTGSTAQIAVLGSDGCHVVDAITEGGNPENNILFDPQGSTTVKMFRVTNLHSENTPTNAIIKSTAIGGMVVVDGVFYQTGAIVFEGKPACANIIKNVPSIPDTPIFAATSSDGGDHWVFENVGLNLPDNDLTRPEYWRDGVVPTMRVHRGSQDELNVQFPTLSGDGFLLHASQPVNGYVKANLRPIASETYDIGHFQSRADYMRWRRGVFGTVATRVRTISAASTTITDLTDHTILCDTTSNVVILLIGASNAMPEGTEFVIKHQKGGNQIRIGCVGAETIDGTSELDINSVGTVKRLKLVGLNWEVL